VNTFAFLRPSVSRAWLYLALRFLLVHMLSLEVQAKVVARHIFPGANQKEMRQVVVNQIMQSNVKGYRATMRALARFNVLSRLREIQAPTLVISGENDATIPLDYQRILANGIPNARHVIIPNAGHAVIVDQPDRFNSALSDFLCEDDE
jgi:3-oxoadipate enol-lactonase